KEHLVRVLNNLITNAIQAIPDDRAGEVAMLLNTEVGNKIRLEIRDNGSGIPEEAREKVFAPYFTTKSSGTGLGLAMTRNIIEAMSGDIYFQTESGKGTSFFIVLPLMPADAEKD
ncbi:MAG: sensor histidine kinase, partial [Saprospiraceae bacterium]|nr:sensor histidine kinase [Saprospiraceae bacterium]